VLVDAVDAAPNAPGGFHAGLVPGVDLAGLG